MDEELYDLEAVYDAQIAPLMEQITAICKEHNLPMIASFAYCVTPEQLSFCTTCLGEGARVPDKFKQIVRFLVAR